RSFFKVERCFLSRDHNGVAAVCLARCSERKDMRKYAYVSAALLAAALSSASQAAPRALDCSTILAQGAMHTCFSQEWKDADDALNRKYQELVARLKAQNIRPDAFTMLRDSERAWIQYRDTQCAFESYQSVGATRTMARFRCVWPR